MRFHRYHTLLLFSLSFLPQSQAFAHGGENHKGEDSIIISPAQEAEILKKQRRGEALVPRKASIPGQEHLLGKWEGPYNTPVVAVHTTLLPNGTVMFHDSVGDFATESYPDQSYTRAALWDPAASSVISEKVQLGYNFFCSGHAKLPNGQLLIAGGNKNQALQGLNTIINYDPFSTLPFVNQFKQTAWMNSARWYPTVTPLANGEMLISGGGPTIPEVRGVNGSYSNLGYVTENFAANSSSYHWLTTTPNGKIAHLGPNQQLRYLYTANGGAWEQASFRDSTYRDYGSYASYDVGKVLIAGGGYAPSVASAVSVELNTLTPTVTSSMKYARRQHNLTTLADGSVLATGGFSGYANHFDYSNAVYAAELWNPSTQLWTELADMKVHRAYHSTALLMPDGRVFSGGGGICGDCVTGGYLQKNAEIFTPPYLFKKDGSGQLATRPVISNSSASITPGQVFAVISNEAQSIRKISLIRLGSVTHGVNMEQGYIPLKFSLNSSDPNRLEINAPDNNFIAAPGYYMLFIINDQGVPSVAKILKVNQIATTSPSPLVTAFQHAYFTGNAQAFGVGSYDVNRLTTVGNDTISSLLISPGYTVKACSDQGGNGVCKTYTNNQSFTADFNDVISYLQVYKTPSPVVTVFQHAYFAGNAQSFGVGSYDVNQLTTVGNDTISSLLISPGYAVKACSDQGGNGVCKTYTNNQNFIADFNDVISYLQVYKTP